jgi:C1A family cysteine protease
MNTAQAIHIQNIKNDLKKKKAVVIAIVRESFFYNNRNKLEINFPEDYQQNSENGNHDICIVGFNDTINNGSFLVKNNYDWWGINGFAYV